MEHSAGKGIFSAFQDEQRVAVVVLRLPAAESGLCGGKAQNGLPNAGPGQLGNGGVPVAAAEQVQAMQAVSLLPGDGHGVLPGQVIEAVLPK